jgi:tyrosine-protein kinase Etk/Wzc
MNQPSPAGLRAPQPAEPDELSTIDLILMLARRRGLIAACTAVAAAGAALAALLLPAWYTGTATMVTPKGDAITKYSLGMDLLHEEVPPAERHLKFPNDPYVGLMTSATIEDDLIRRFDLMRVYRKRTLWDTRRELEKRAVVDGDGLGGLIRVDVTDHSPERAAALANAYIEEFRAQSQRLANAGAAQREAVLEGQLSRAQQSLREAEADLARSEERTHVVALNEQTRQLIAADAGLRGKIAAMETQIDGMTTWATDDNPGMVEARQTLEGLRDELAQLEKQHPDADAVLLSGSTAAEDTMDYARAERTVTYRETTVDNIRRQEEFARLDALPPLTEVVDAAVPPQRRSGPDRTGMVTGAAIFGFLAGVTAALALAQAEALGNRPAPAAKLSRLRRSFSRSEQAG